VPFVFGIQKTQLLEQTSHVVSRSSLRWREQACKSKCLFTGIYFGRPAGLCEHTYVVDQCCWPRGHGVNPSAVVTDYEQVVSFQRERKREKLLIIFLQLIRML